MENKIENFIFKGNQEDLCKFIINSEYYLIPIAKWDQLLIVYNKPAFMFQSINNSGDILSLEYIEDRIFGVGRCLLEMHASFEFIDHIKELLSLDFYYNEEYEDITDEMIKNQKTFKLDPEFYDIKTSDYYDKIGKDIIEFDTSSIKITYNNFDN